MLVHKQRGLPRTIFSVAVVTFAVPYAAQAIELVLPGKNKTKSVPSHSTSVTKLRVIKEGWHCADVMKTINPEHRWWTSYSEPQTQIAFSYQVFVAAPLRGESASAAALSPVHSSLCTSKLISNLMFFEQYGNHLCSNVTWRDCMVRKFPTVDSAYCTAS